MLTNLFGYNSNWRNYAIDYRSIISLENKGFKHYRNIYKIAFWWGTQAGTYNYGTIEKFEELFKDKIERKP